jgi:hypothetical protein
LHTLLITLIVFVTGLTTFAMLRRHTTKAATPTSFTVTNGDTYLFTNTTPGEYTSGSDTVVLGTWSVVDQTTGANIGDIAGGTITARASGAGVAVSTVINAPAPLGRIESGFTTFPPLVDYTKSAEYQNDIHRGYIPDSMGPITPMGDAFLEMQCPNITQGDPYCDQLGIDTDSVADLGEPGSLPRQQMDYGIGDQQTAWLKAQQATALIAPSEQLALASHLGGGPRAALQQQRPAFAPLLLFGLGALLAGAGVLTASVCFVKTGCSTAAKVALVIIGAIMAIIGIAIGAAAAAVLAWATQLTVQTGVMAAGSTLTETAMTLGSSSMTLREWTAMYKTLSYIAGYTVAPATDFSAGLLQGQMALVMAWVINAL